MVQCSGVYSAFQATITGRVTFHGFAKKGDTFFLRRCDTHFLETRMRAAIRLQSFARQWVRRRNAAIAAVDAAVHDAVHYKSHATDHALHEDKDQQAGTLSQSQYQRPMLLSQFELEIAASPAGASTEDNSGGVDTPGAGVGEFAGESSPAKGVGGAAEAPSEVPTELLSPTSRARHAGVSQYQLEKTAQQHLFSAYARYSQRCIELLQDVASELDHPLYPVLKVPDLSTLSVHEISQIIGKKPWIPKPDPKLLPALGRIDDHALGLLSQVFISTIVTSTAVHCHVSHAPSTALLVPACSHMPRAGASLAEVRV